MSQPGTADSNPPQGVFRTTHWSVVLAAREGQASQASQALETLCRTYWYPLYVFVRRQGFSVEDAQDLTQEFFARLLRRDFLRTVAREKGRFRSFLLVSLKNFLATEWRRGQTAKRGGGQSLISWDELQAEGRYQHEPMTEATPEELYDQRWALTAIEQAMGRLREEFVTAGKAEQFERLKPWLSNPGSRAEYAAVAGQWGMTASAVSVAVHRLRRRFAELLRSVVAHTVPSPDEIEAEVQFLARALQ
jgi:RNA polymerase sigma factor (sigma-70 family)